MDTLIEPTYELEPHVKVARARAGVLMLGVGGLAQLIVPTVSVFYTGRYLVPVAGLVAGAAAISARSLALAAARHVRLDVSGSRGGGQPRDRLVPIAPG